MAKARMYGWSEKRFNGATKKVAELKGQAGLVRDVLDNLTDLKFDADGIERATFLATDVTTAVVATGKLVTRQDSLRVVLYYLLVFKKRGWVVAAEQPVEDDDIEDTDADDDDNDEETGDEFDGDPVGAAVRDVTNTPEGE